MDPNRKKCPACKVKPVAVNYHHKGKIYYKRLCHQCARLGRRPAPPGWVRSGYKPKAWCDKCGFKFKVKQQMNVVYVDGNQNNNDWVNLKTICLNCLAEIKLNNLPWKPYITPDY